MYLLLALLGLCALTAAQPCTPAITGCDCPNAEYVQCKGLDALPSQLPAAATAFYCDACDLKDLNSTFPASYNQLTILSLTGCNINHISKDAFSGLTSLISLDLSNNYFHTIYNDPFKGLINLIRLILRECRISELMHDAFNNLPKLAEVDLTSNEGLTLPATLFDGSPVKYLLLRLNKMSAIPVDLLAKTDTLTKLDLDHNAFNTVPSNAFKNLNKLQELQMNKCGIQTLEKDAFAGLSNLVFLNLGFNNISSVESSMFSVFRNTLKKLYLENNKLDSIPMDLVPWEKLDEVMLGGNPWFCDCDLHWMSRVPLEHIDPENITCVGPVNATGRSVHNVTAELDCSLPEFGGTNTATIVIIVILIILLVVFLGICAYKYLKKRQHPKRNVHYHAVYKDTTAPNSQAAGAPPRPPRPVSVL